MDQHFFLVNISSSLLYTACVSLLSSNGNCTEISGVELSPSRHMALHSPGATWLMVHRECDERSKLTSANLARSLVALTICDQINYPACSCDSVLCTLPTSRLANFQTKEEENHYRQLNFQIDIKVK